MVVYKTESRPGIFIDNHKIRKDKDYKYLGVMISDEEKINDEVNSPESQ